MNIHRQSDETEISELAGAIIEEFLGVDDPISKEMLFFYVTLSGIGYRFFIDEGILFWAEHSKDPEDDLEEGQEYIDFLSLYDVNLQAVQKIEMANSCLKLILESGVFFVEEYEEKTFVKYIKNQ